MLFSFLFLAAVLPVSAEEADSRHSYDFDLTFSLNAGAFPALVRSRAEGYAALVNRLGIRGSVAWDDTTRSLDMNGSLYFTDNESLSYPFRLFGVPSRLFITFPETENEVIFLNMAALADFSIKAKNTLNVPLFYAAVLYPYTSEVSFSGLKEAWAQAIGRQEKSGRITKKQSAAFASLVQDQLDSNSFLRLWIQALAGGSESPEAVDAFFYDLGNYCRVVTGGRNISVSISPSSEVWQNADGQTLYSAYETDGGKTYTLSLPANQYGYVPFLTYSSRSDEQTSGFDLHASVLRDGYRDGYAESSKFWPDTLLDCSVSASGLPLSIPSDSAFSVTGIINGAVYPNYAFVLRGETKNDGSVSLLLYKPFSRDAEPVMILQCSGTVLPAEPVSLPDYLYYDLTATHNVFSFNEERLAAFRSAVLPALVRSVFSFVAAAPTAACQSFLDDLTDMGILQMLLD